MFHILLLITLGWFVIFYRLFSIQIKDTRDFSANHIDLIESSVAQRQQEFVLSSGRGNIYDRNMNSLLAQQEIITTIVFPFSKDFIDTEKYKALADIINLDYEDLLNQVKELESPSYLKKYDKPIEITLEQQQQIERLSIPGVVATPYTTTDFESISAKHVIGYLGKDPEYIERYYGDYVERGVLDENSMIGRSGLQLQFQELLMGVGESKIAYFVDNRGNPLNGLSSKYLIQNDPYYPLSLVTTIDSDIQLLVEETLGKYDIDEGSVVILDVDNGDILAMASAPDYNLLKVDPSENDWNNKAVQAIEPGSTFKTLITIAALEEGVVTPDEVFYCDGEDEQYHFTCHDEHGYLTFEEGFAESCNIVYGEVAKRLGSEKIQYYAEKLNLVGEVSWTGDFFRSEDFSQIANEESNRVFHQDTNLNDPGSIMRTAIGQQDVRISPLAAANLVVTILNNGTVYDPRLVEKVVYKNGTDYYQFPVLKDNSGVGRDTYGTVREFMEKVVDDGTGQLLNQAIWDLAGKTGTAETNSGLTHQWFIGYGPTDKPKYAVAVAINNVSTSEPLAKKVFLDIMDGLARME